MMAELSISDVRRMYELTMGVPAYACGVLKDGVVLPGTQIGMASFCPCPRLMSPNCVCHLI